jgi:predicted  nucleic acid-binding Zn-ribbon protein
MNAIEIERLKQKIQILEKENIELKNQLQPFLDEVNKRKQYLERRDKIDEKLNQMLYNFYNKKP